MILFVSRRKIKAMQEIDITPRVKGTEEKHLRGMVRTFRFPSAAKGTARLAPGPGADSMGNDGARQIGRCKLKMLIVREEFTH